MFHAFFGQVPGRFFFLIIGYYSITTFRKGIKVLL